MRNATSRILTGTLAGALLVAASAHADRSEWPDNFTVGTA
ncbi:C4-dicarboxylate ABC transporter substrate-binding protein, partial [Halomonas sp. LBP4]